MNTIREGGSMKKKCTKCGEVKPLTLFNKDKSYKGGHHTWCKKCKNGRNTERLNTEKGYLKMRYGSIKGKEFKKARWGRKSKCYFTFDEFLTAFEKHRSIYGMRSAWGPGPDRLEEHLPITMSQEGKGQLGKKGPIKGSKQTVSNLSVDRLDTNLDYTLQNIIFIRLDENQRKKNTSYEDCKIQVRLHEERFRNEIKE
jgi:hypothetical protein